MSDFICVRATETMGRMVDALYAASIRFALQSHLDEGLSYSAVFTVADEDYPAAEAIAAALSIELQDCANGTVS